MVYLGPIIRLTPSVKSKPSTGYEPDRDLLIDKSLPQKVHPELERRGGDRRKRREKPLVEMRSGRDRRRKKRIDIEV